MTGRYAALFDDVALGAAWLAADQARNALLDEDFEALVRAPGGISTTSIAIGTGSKSWTLGATATMPAGTWYAMSAGSQGNFMVCDLAATLESGTALTMTSLIAVGSGTFTDWIFVPLSNTRRAVAEKAADYTVLNSDFRSLTVMNKSSAAVYTIPAASTLGTAFEAEVVNVSAYPVAITPNAVDAFDGKAVGVVSYLLPGESLAWMVKGANDIRVTASKGYGAPLRPHPTVQTGSFNALAGFAYSVNTSGGAATPTLPANSALAGDELIAFDDVAATFGTYNCTLTAGSGSTIMGAATFPLNVSYVGARLRYRKSTTDWRILT